MSRYNTVWLRTYVGSTLLLLSTIAIWFAAGYDLHDNGIVSALLALMGCLFCVLTFHSFSTGRRYLASNHWRAEDFRP